MSSLEEGKFWEIMKDNELVWLHDERGNNITACPRADPPLLPSLMQPIQSWNLGRV
jgi:hypothetical protein